MDHLVGMIIHNISQIILVALFIASLLSTIIGAVCSMFDWIKQLSNKHYETSRDWSKLFFIGVSGLVMSFVALHITGVINKIYVSNFHY
jgi:hypothetical protein